MNTLLKIALAGVSGTILMTAFSYLIADHENEQYREPELLNKLVDRSRKLPAIVNTRTNPVGWVTHFGIGLGFVAGYRIIWPQALHKPQVGSTLLIGAASGLIGIASWHTFFTNHDNPPNNDRKGYYEQLFVAHLIFSAVSIYTYKAVDSTLK